MIGRVCVYLVKEKLQTHKVITKTYIHLILCFDSFKNKMNQYSDIVEEI